MYHLVAVASKWYLYGHYIVHPWPLNGHSTISPFTKALLNFYKKRNVANCSILLTHSVLLANWDQQQQRFSEIAANCRGKKDGGH